MLRFVWFEEPTRCYFSAIYFQTVLSSFGDILDFVVLSGKDGKFKGTVRVTFKNWDEGADVIKKMNGQVADG